MGRAERVSDAVRTMTAVARTGLLHPVRPDRMVRMARAVREWGPTTAGLVAVARARHPDRTAVVDARGELTWAGLDERTDAVARGLVGTGVGAGTTVGILCRNHRGFVESVVAAAKLGADAVLLNTGFAAPQLAEVVGREGVDALLHDGSFEPAIVEAGLGGLRRAIAWDGSSPDGVGGAPTFDDLATTTSGSLRRPDRPGQVTILSSGTTGTPKGARRSTERTGSRGAAGSQVAVLTRVPLRAGDTTLVSAPLFHSWGLSALITAATFGSPMVLRERFDPEDALAAIDRHEVGTFIAVPVMLQRILDLPLDRRVRHDTSSLRVVFLSGSALPGTLAHRWMDAFGDNLYSLYGSTEVATVAIADPADLRADPSTAGPVLSTVDVRLLGDDDAEVRPGEPGRIFVRTGMAFEGYTDGGTKPVVDGYMGTGDVGRIVDGRLRVEGREDDMIVSGGENVVPAEVEQTLFRHPDVADAAVVGVPDAEFGQRLVAHVVLVEGSAVDAAALRTWVRDNLAGYKTPREVVIREELPRNPTGKVLRRVLIDPTSEGPAEDRS